MLGRFAKAKLLSRSNTGTHEGFFFVNLFSVGINCLRYGNNNILKGEILFPHCPLPCLL